MQSPGDKLLARGMALIRRLPEVAPDQADARVRGLYEEVRQVLRVPFVNLLFRLLARDMDYLERAWRGLVPLLRTRAFERASDALRAQALLEGFERRAEWRRLEDAGRLRALTDSIHYVLPKLLLISTALGEPALAGHDAPHIDRERVPGQVAEGSEKVDLLGPEDAPGPVAALLEDIRRAHGHPRLASCYRALGQWPDFLEDAWAQLKPVVGGPAYVERRERLVTQARALMRGLPYRPVPPSHAALDVEALLAVFRQRLVPELLLDVTALKALLDGAAEARASRLSAVPAPGSEEDEDWPDERHPLHALSTPH